MLVQSYGNYDDMVLHLSEKIEGFSPFLKPLSKIPVVVYDDRTVYV